MRTIKSKITLVLCAVGAVVMMVMIFRFSSAPATASAQQSGEIVEKVAEVVDIKPETPEYSSLSSIIRKLAHISEFAALGFFLFGVTCHFNLATKMRFTLSIGLSFLYALSDEIHQLFSNGRAFQISDLALDTLGAIIGCFAFWMMLWLIFKIVQCRKTEIQN